MGFMDQLKGMLAGQQGAAGGQAGMLEDVPGRSAPAADRQTHTERLGAAPGYAQPGHRHDQEEVAGRVSHGDERLWKHQRR